MANLPETPQWEDGIYQIEVSDPVLGGPDGISNRQAKQLASRTSYLKQQVEKGSSDLSEHIKAADPHTQYAPKASPTFTGNPAAPTVVKTDNSTKLANTAHVKTVVADYAPLASPALTGTPTAPTAPQTVNNTQIATTAFVKSALAALVASSPEALDTLNELAAALGNDPNFATTMTNALAGKQPLDNTLTALSGKSVAALLEYLGLREIYATREDVGEKLDKSKVTNSLINSREFVPTTALLIDNLNLKQEKGDYATVDELKKITLPKGMVSFFLHRENSLPAGWYSLNGDRYSADSFAGKALRALPAEIKSDWGIIDSGTTITTPNLRQSDGRLPFIRPSNGKGSSPGIVTGDTIRDITGEFGYESQYGLTSSDSDVSGAFYAYGPSRKSLMGGGTGQTTNIAFKASKTVPTGTENKPLSVDMIAAVYLGVA